MTRKDICFFLFPFLLFPGCNGKNRSLQVSEASVPVILSRAESISSLNEIELSGNIEGYKTVRLGFMVPGKINFIGVDEGGQVSKDRVLASLDPENYRIAKELADIQVSQVQDEYDRLSQMYDKKSLSESDYVKISSGLQQAKAQQRLHGKNLSETRLFSPIDGILLKKLTEVGEIISTGLPVFVVSDIRKVKVNAFIPENELHKIKLGQTAKVTVSSLSENFEGNIIEVGSAADPASRAFSVKIEINNPGLRIRPGMIAEITIQPGAVEKFLAVPVEALLHDYDNQSYVYVADTLKGRAFRRNVSPGRLLNDKIEITAGLRENELIVGGGQSGLVDGALITISK